MADWHIIVYMLFIRHYRVLFFKSNNMERETLPVSS